jgi:hypothetical protein
MIILAAKLRFKNMEQRLGFGWCIILVPSLFALASTRCLIL